MTPEQIASLAQSLEDNEVFQMALDGQRTSALDVLATIDASDTLGILKHQAIVKVVDDIRADLKQFIRSGQKRGAPGIA